MSIPRASKVSSSALGSCLGPGGGAFYSGVGEPTSGVEGTASSSPPTWIADGDIA